MLSTKESLEDLLADVGDHMTRDCENPFNVSPERIFMLSTLSRRLKMREPKYLELQRGDYTSDAARKCSRNRRLTFGEHAAMKSQLVQSMKVLVAQGASGVTSIACS